MTTASDVKNYETKLCNFDVIISIGYRTKSKRGVEFRRWATDVLRRYIVDGNAANEQRLRQPGRSLALWPASRKASKPVRCSTSCGATPRRWICWTITIISALAGGRKSIDGSTLVAVTVMIAESKSEEKDAMVALVMNFLVMGSGD